jgi:hypothetical protein
MRPVLIVAILAGLLASGCYVVDYRYDYYHDPYDEAYDGYYHRSYPVVRYHSPIEPLIDLAILGAVLHGWSHWRPRSYCAPSYPHGRIRR